MAKQQRLKKEEEEDDKMMLRSLSLAPHWNQYPILIFSRWNGIRDSISIMIAASATRAVFFCSLARLILPLRCVACVFDFISSLASHTLDPHTRIEIPSSPNKFFLCNRQHSSAPRLGSGCTSANRRDGFRELDGRSTKPSTTLDRSL